MRSGGLITAAAALIIGIPGPAPSQTTDGTALPDCPVRFAGRADPSAAPTEPFDCHCTAGARNAGGGYAYGSGPYEGISNICMAALHAGATGKDGGDVQVIPRGLRSNYVGSLANGVFSADWQHSSQFPSFDVLPAGDR